MERTYTQEEVIKLFRMGYHIGVDDGEAGIPSDFTSYNPRHMEWYSELCLSKEKLVFENIDEILK